MVTKQLSDFPVGTPMEAADGCQYCGVKYQVTIRSLEDGGQCGMVYWTIKHHDACPDRWDAENYGDELEDANEVITGDMAGWTWCDGYLVPVAGSLFPALAERLNIGPCVGCLKLVIGVPLILFPEDGSYELDFCWECADRLGLLKQLR